jgi:hypothetical protein
MMWGLKRSEKTGHEMIDARSTTLSVATDAPSLFQPSPAPPMARCSGRSSTAASAAEEAAAWTSTRSIAFVRKYAGELDRGGYNTERAASFFATC